MWLWRPVRLLAVMVAVSSVASSGAGLLAAQAATAGLLFADGLRVAEVKQ
jgi:hypothetical protein